MDWILRLGMIWITLGGAYWFGFVALGYRFAEQGDRTVGVQHTGGVRAHHPH